MDDSALLRDRHRDTRQARSRAVRLDVGVDRRGDRRRNRRVDPRGDRRGKGRGQGETDGSADKLLALERARLATWLGHPTAEAGGGYGFLVVRAAAGLVTGYGVTAGLLLSGLLLSGGSWELLTSASESVPFDFPGVKVISNIGVMGLLTGGFLLVLTLTGALAAGAAERRLADRLLGPSGQERMRRRIAVLTATRSDIVRAVDDERRRIERDLHDGVQQRGIALAMLLGRAQHAADPAKARRVRALDGAFTVDSPPGGPTRIAATLPKEVPCA
ncbi:histidine kinase dimerization/phosphoacceptor domain-containing protein [Nonomuraea glycinis]|uniref:histidine kinase n=1 Tax=Nonomuraea glycinis TaxID=2047744 RepID=UPI001CD9B2F1|nr:histidine kinase dimerization/phosphoacceptor domain-containing protein [Nonomuraea glycinis]MCA2177900.1 histidine kinase dimerization/phosphoacceptor domain-containing protein [Nonomuraea glycinis]